MKKNKKSKLGKTINEWGVFIEFKDKVTGEIVLPEKISDMVSDFLFKESKRTDLCGHRNSMINTNGKIVW